MAAAGCAQQPGAFSASPGALSISGVDNVVYGPTPASAPANAAIYTAVAWPDFRASRAARRCVASPDVYASHAGSCTVSWFDRRARRSGVDGIPGIGQPAGTGRPSTGTVPRFDLRTSRAPSWPAAIDGRCSNCRYVWPAARARTLGLGAACHAGAGDESLHARFGRPPARRRVRAGRIDQLVSCQRHRPNRHAADRRRRGAGSDQRPAGGPHRRQAPARATSASRMSRSRSKPIGRSSSSAKSRSRANILTSPT